MVLQQEYEATGAHDQLLECLQECFYVVNLLSYVLMGHTESDLKVFLDRRKQAVDFGRQALAFGPPRRWQNAGLRWEL